MKDRPNTIFGAFFFSSRRRHTRWTGDWSSDVCSSDLERSFNQASDIKSRIQPAGTKAVKVDDHIVDFKIGRASCRERVKSWVGADILKKEGMHINGPTLPTVRYRVRTGRYAKDHALRR